MLQPLTNQSSAFLPGSDLWALASLTDSQMTQKLDWLTGFSFSKTEMKKAQALPAVIQSVVTACELPSLGNFENRSAWSMIPTEKFFPNRWTLIFGGEPNAKIWTESLYQAWEKLGFCSLRIFLPPWLPLADFQNLWPKTDMGEKNKSFISIVTENNG